MLVMLAGDKLISPQKVCPGCLFADHTGQPRWYQGRLQCGNQTQTLPAPNHQFECPMGFRLVEIEQ